MQQQEGKKVTIAQITDNNQVDTEDENIKKKVDSKLTRILSIDGGGIRGILPGQILAALEEKLKIQDNNPDARLADYFDLIAGTSTGGILSCILLSPSEEDPKKARYSAKDAVNLYLENGHQIFKMPFLHRLRTLGGILDEKFPSYEIETILKRYFGDLKLSQLLKPSLITSYDVKRGKPKFFTQHDAIEGYASGNSGKDFYVRDVARATSAAPTYFESANIFSISGVGYPLVDGGVFANNPSLCAYAEARRMSFGEGKINPGAKRIFMLSLGTGSSDRSYEYNRVRKWGKIEWIKPIIDIMMNGVSQTVDYQLRQIYDAVEAPDQYIRINPKTGDAKSDMDNAELENLKALSIAGIESAEIHSDVLDHVAKTLIANK